MTHVPTIIMPNHAMVVEWFMMVEEESAVYIDMMGRVLPDKNQREKILKVLHLINFIDRVIVK